LKNAVNYTVPKIYYIMLQKYPAAVTDWQYYCTIIWKSRKSIMLPGIWTHRWYPTTTD